MASDPIHVWGSRVGLTEAFQRLRAQIGPSADLDLIWGEFGSHIPPSLEDNCEVCGPEDCDCWPDEGQRINRVLVEWAEYGYQPSGVDSLALLASRALSAQDGPT